MNSKLKASGIIALTMSLMACAPMDDQSNSIDSKGHCTAKFIADLNGVASLIKPWVQTYKNIRSKIESNAEMTTSELEALADDIISQSVSVNQSCVKFFSAHSNVSCMAYNDRTGAEEMVVTDRLRMACKEAHSILEEAKNAQVQVNIGEKKKTAEGSESRGDGDPTLPPSIRPENAPMEYSF